MADNQLGGGSSGPAAPQPWEKVTSLLAPSTELNIRGKSYIAVAPLYCVYFNTSNKTPKKITQVMLMFFIFRLNLLSFVQFNFEFTKT